VRKRDIRWIRILAYSAITLSSIAGIVLLVSGAIGAGLVVLVIAILLGLAFARIEQYLKREAEIV
jgi:cytochrome c biogenesis protein CcdA